ncbi:MAG: hypothetical protein HFJ60_08425 [Clostridia bacterium]|jgi:hypothetical protein|nr:hypothetical protein [Clostridia bacterium]
MNLEIQEKEKISKKTIAIYMICISICILAIIVVIGIQILGNDVIDNIFGINKITKRTEQEEATLKANFEDILKNEIEKKQDYDIQKINNTQEIIYTSYEKKEKNDKYDININLPYININNKEAQDFNNEMKETFETKAENIIKDKSENVIYTVKYQANIENNILSLIVYCDLKEETSAQRVIIRTFNFNLKDKKEINLEKTIEGFNLKQKNVQNKIKKDIKEAQRKSDDLKALGYNIFSRDLDSEIYNVKNIEEFFIYNNNIYIIFAYGNNKLTSEKDIVII